MRIVYSPRYNISFFGLERLHPFDSRKYARAWNLLKQRFGSSLAKYNAAVDRPVSDEELLLVHTREYLDSLRSPASLAAALEMPVLGMLPAGVTAWRVLQPMRWAVRGSVIAAKAALESGAAVNLSGGYHHAKPDRGEGFCIFSDIALIVHQLRRENLLRMNDTVAYVDLDAHQGNGVCHQFRADKQLYIFDMYNKSIYPASDIEARRRIDANFPLPHECSGTEYLAILRQNLPGFLDSLAHPRPRLAIYNAGTDVFAGDQLGGLSLSANDVLQRDLFVVNEFRRREIPFVMLLSGGYSQESYRLVANTVTRLIEDELNR